MFRKPSDNGARQGNPGKSGHHENHQIYDNVNAGGKFQQPYREPDIQDNHRHNTHGHHKMSPSRHRILSPFPFLHAPWRRASSAAPIARHLVFGGPTWRRLSLADRPGAACLWRHPYHQSVIRHGPWPVPIGPRINRDPYQSDPCQSGPRIIEAPSIRATAHHTTI